MGEHGPHAIIHGPDDWLYLVIGNHAWARPEKLAPNSPLTRWPDGRMGPDQGRLDTTEDVLLPRLNDARGHAANILAPGGTIWRLDHEGKNFSLVAAGFRNHYDAAFSKQGELFTFDSDMEWDEGLPWYRAVRVCHCPPGADFLWRTGAANTPDYYIDSLPPVLETGRGSPVGVEFYDHTAFPEKYRGSLFLADWAIGVIFAVNLGRDGATYRASAERFCVGAPMNVTDVAVGPDGALYFTMGGRGTQGGVYRIAWKGGTSFQSFVTQGVMSSRLGKTEADQAIQVPQPLSAWGRARIAALRKETDDQTWESRLKAVAQDNLVPIFTRLRALELLQNYGPKPDAKFLVDLAGVEADDHPFIRAHAVWLLGLNAYPDGRAALLSALHDDNALVRRRACEALIRAGFEPKPDELRLLLADSDRFVRTAARLVLQRIDPKLWAKPVLSDKSDYIVMEGAVALCKTNQAQHLTDVIFDRLAKVNPGESVDYLLDYLRTVQLVMVHTKERPPAARAIARRCVEVFPHTDDRVNRELAILMTAAQRERLLDEPVCRRLASALFTSQDRQQQIHYFYCLRLLHEGWRAEDKARLARWFEATKSWTGGHSFTPFLENIFRDLAPAYTRDEVTAVATDVEHLPRATMILLQAAPEVALPPAGLLGKLLSDPAVKRAGEGQKELQEAVVTALGRSPDPEAAPVLRQIARTDAAHRDAAVRAIARSPSPQDFDLLVSSLSSSQQLVLLDVIQALTKLPLKPKPEDGKPYRAVLLAAGRLNPNARGHAVALLRHWNSKKFSPEEGDWRTELDGWARWYHQSFPKEPPLPNAQAATTTSKWKFEELLKFLEHDPAGKNGDPRRGRLVFEKANCLKCHKYGTEGEGIGPDLTTLKSRFKRVDVLESLIYPSKVISDQYRGSTILTKKGATITGLAAPQGNIVIVLQQDGTKVTLKADEIENQVASTISPMPDKLLDELTLQEIADLFAFLESEPKK
jgi:putative heme-binding domain-containing protein